MNPTRSASDCRIERYDAAGVVDAGAVQRVSVSPGSLLLERQGQHARVLAAGRPDEVDHHPASAVARRIDESDSVLIPALVNAHAHLDLTDVGPHPPDLDGGFAAFIELVRARRPRTPEAISAAVGHGVELSLAGGTAAIGDIAGAVDGRPRLDAWIALSESPLSGVSYLEFFAMGRGEERGLAVVQSVVGTPSGSGSSRLRLGLQPHAPYSVSLEAYRWAVQHAAAHSMPLCTHLAESPEERACIGTARGPIREFLERVGIWDDALLGAIGRSQSPVAHIAGVLAHGMLAVHVNDASDADIEVLVRAGARVVYCPRAAAHFRAEHAFGPHRYRDMLSAGIPVALGTDSVINLCGEGGGEAPVSLSILDEMRFLCRRDAAPPHQLLAMGTVNGAIALGLDPAAFRFTPGSAVAGVLAIRVADTPADLAGPDRVLRSTSPPRWLTGPGAA